MVIGLMYCLRCCWRCRLFWSIQALQLLEIPSLLKSHYDIHEWFNWDFVNIIPNGAAVFLAIKHFRFASWLFGIYFILKINEWAGMETVYEQQHGWLFWARFLLNEVLLFVLLGYPVRKVILHLWRTYVEPARSSGRTKT